MHPLILSKEIDGFVADRLMEALWREALWLVNDGVATAAEIDDAIRFGPGLRWSFMGTFLIYRIAGGEAGMRHFMAQFGPALKWPWTKLMDVPELTDELLDTICAQSDAQVDVQTPGLSIRELEALRDDCLVEVMHGLRNRGFAAGKTLADFEKRLFDVSTRLEDDVDLSVPIRTLERSIPTDWVDYNGHTNDSRYMQLSSQGGDRFLRLIGVDQAYLESGRSYFTVESHVNYLAQSTAGDQVYVTVQLLSHDRQATAHFHDDEPRRRRLHDRDRRAHDVARRRAGRQGVTGAGRDHGQARRDRRPSRQAASPRQLRPLHRPAQDLKRAFETGATIRGRSRQALIELSPCCRSRSR